MKRVVATLCPGLLLLASSLGTATEVDVVISKTAHDTTGDTDHGFIHTQATLTAAANVYRSDDRMPVIRTRAWLWAFAEGDEPSRVLRVMEAGESAEQRVYAWAGDEVREEVSRGEGTRRREFPAVVSIPGVLSRWEFAPGEEWRLAIEPRLYHNVAVLRPLLERVRVEGDTPTSTTVGMPTVSIPVGEARLLGVYLTQPEGATAPSFYLELRPAYDWGAKGAPRTRRRDYGGSWTDRVDVGGQLKVEGVYTNVGRD